MVASMTSSTNDRRDFLISFTQADRPWATWIAWALEGAGYSVFFQDWDFKGNFVLEIDRAHARSCRTIAVLSPDYLASRFAAPEWAARFAQDATSEHDLLIPVRVRPCELEGLLAQVVYVDLIGWDEVAARDKLLRRVKGIRLKPAEVPSFPREASHQATLERPDFPTAGGGGVVATEHPCYATTKPRGKRDTTNEGIIQTGGTISAGVLAVGKGAQAKSHSKSHASSTEAKHHLAQEVGSPDSTNYSHDEHNNKDNNSF